MLNELKVQICSIDGILDIGREAASVPFVQQSGRDWFENALASWGF